MAKEIDDAVSEGMNVARGFWESWTDHWSFKPVIGIVALIVFLKIYRRVRRLIIRRRPARLHVKLQPYGEGSLALPEHATVRRKEAAKIVATSSGPAIVGYELIEQVEAVFVDGFRRPEDAVEGLKAAAAMKGANAIVNVNTSSQGARYAASGDGVIVARYEEPPVGDFEDDSQGDGDGAPMPPS